MREIIYIDKIGEVEINTNKRIVYLKLSFHSDGKLILNLPRNIKKKDAISWLESNTDEIVSKKESLLRKNIQLRKFRIDDTYKTRNHLIHIVSGKRRNTGNDLFICLNPNITNSILENDRMQNKIKDYIDNVYRDEAAKILPMRIRELSRIHKLPFFKLSLRNNVSRWGSCSSENNINLNIHLMRLPDYLIDYVLLHELTHTIIKDHSRKFWDYLSKICPNLDECRREMKNYSTRTYSPN